MAPQPARSRLAVVIAVVALLTAALLVPVSATGAVVERDVRHVGWVPGTTGGHSFAYGDRLYVGAYGFGMRIFDVAEPAAPREIGRYIPGPQSTSDPGVRADAVPVATVIDGRHIAVLNGTRRHASTTQSEFLDVTDPAEPKLLWRFTGPNDGEAHNGDILHERRLWLPSGGTGGNGLRIYDLNPLLGESPVAPENLFRADPVALWDQSPHRGDKEVGTPFTHTHDLEIYPNHRVLLPDDQWVDSDSDGTPDPTYAERDIVFLAEGGDYLAGNNRGSIFVIDVTDAANPVVLNRWQHPEGGHAIRYFHEVQLLDGDPTVMIVTDEDMHNGCDAGGVYTVRLSEDLRSATKLAEYFNGLGKPAPVCSVHVFSTHDQHMFIGSYNAGLQVLDLSDPSNPTPAGEYIAPGANSWGALYHEGYVYVGDMGGRGLDVFEFIPDAVASGTLVTGNPAATQVSGINETECEVNGSPGAPTVDALAVAIPEEHRTGASVLRAAGSGVHDYDLNVYFHDADCAWMTGVSLNWEAKDIEGKIPAGAHWAFVTNVLPGPPLPVYVQIR